MLEKSTSEENPIPTFRQNHSYFYENHSYFLEFNYKCILKARNDVFETKIFSSYDIVVRCIHVVEYFENNIL